MARVKRAVNALKKRRKVMRLAKGYFGAKSKQYRAASEQVRRSLRYAYIGRKLKKRDFRRLWIARINAAARQNGLSYSRLINGLKVAGIDINRKMLSEIAINDPAAFAALAEKAKAAVKYSGQTGGSRTEPPAFFAGKSLARRANCAAVVDSCEALGL